MTERDPGTTDVDPADDSELEDEEPLEDDERLEDEEPESEEEAEEEAPGVAPAPAGGRRSVLRGRGLRRGAAGSASDIRRTPGSIRGEHEARVRIDDRFSAIYALVAAGSLIGVLLFSLTLAPGGFLNPRVTQRPAPTVSTVPQFVTQQPGAPTPAPSASGSVAPSATPTPSPTPVASAT